MSLIWSYIWQEDMKCSSVSTSLCGQWAQREPGLRMVAYLNRKAMVNESVRGQSQVLCHCALCLGPESIPVCSGFWFILSNESSKYIFVLS